MHTIESIHTYPVTGGQGVSASVGHLDGRTGGLFSDRTYVPFHPDKVNDDGSYERVKSKRNPEVTLFSVWRDGTGDEIVYEGSQTFLTGDDYQDEVRIDEFGDRTVGVDLGDRIADFYSGLIGFDIRIAFVEAENRAKIPRDSRKVAPLHIVSTASVQFVADTVGIDYDEAVRRFRPNIVINNWGEDPHSEQDWVGRTLVLGNSDAQVCLHRATPRCAVPGRDSRTGERMGDIPKLYRGFPQDITKDGSSPLFGVYGYFTGEDTVRIDTGDIVDAD